MSDVRCPVENRAAEAALGWMYARIQTWFPFHIQIGINGREWLAQQMRQAGLAFQQEKNCFTPIADFQGVQELLNQHLQTDWVDLLTGFAQRLNPSTKRSSQSIPRRITGLVTKANGPPALYSKAANN